jgi:[LSU ribosomal protein L11P]-lysine N-methyltransferase (EC 2.1.1.-)
MGWNKITIDTLTSAEDMISYELTELGATGVEVEDHVSLTEEEMKSCMWIYCQMISHQTMEKQRSAVILMRMKI